MVHQEVVLTRIFFAAMCVHDGGTMTLRFVAYSHMYSLCTSDAITMVEFGWVTNSSSYYWVYPSFVMYSTNLTEWSMPRLMLADIPYGLASVDTCVIEV